jgi:hypothetical protein
MACISLLLAFNMPSEPTPGNEVLMGKVKNYI